MTERKATATATTKTNTGVLHFVQDDGLLGAGPEVGEGFGLDGVEGLAAVDGFGEGRVD
jgi:hypothetical protein